MKSAIKHEEKKEDEITYPCLMISDYDDSVYLFQQECCGIIVNEGAGYESVGYFSNCLNANMFTPFTGTIELSND